MKGSTKLMKVRLVSFALALLCAVALVQLSLPGLASGDNSNGPNFWLQISSVTNSKVSLVLHHPVYTQTGEVYELWSKTNVTAPRWTIETDIWAVMNQNWTPFTVPMLERKSLFLWARDWTGMDENSNGVPDWWEYEHPGVLPPVITGQPAGQTVVQGSDVTFTVGVSSSSTIPLSYQWYFNGMNLSAGAINASLTLTNVQLTNAGNYSAVVTNAIGSVASSNALLTVLVPPSVSLIGPADGSRFVAPTNITFLASAAAIGTSITKVRFIFGNGVELGETASASNGCYSFVWTNAPAGAYSLSAIAMDGHGMASTSSVVNITNDNVVFLEGVNLGGPAVTIEGHSWWSYTCALTNGLSVTNAVASSVSVSNLIPPTDIGTSNMLQSLLTRYRLPPANQQTNCQFSVSKDFTNCYVRVSLTNFPNGYLVTNEVRAYYGWCFNRDIDISANQNYRLTLYYSYGMPDPRFSSPNLNRVNYLLNHRLGTNINDIQNALWTLLGQGNTNINGGGRYVPTANYITMTNMACLYGTHFVPGCDQTAVVTFDPTNNQPIGVEVGGTNCDNDTKAIGFALLQTNLANGYYYVYGWLLEDQTNNARNLNINVQGVTVATGIGTNLALGDWVKLGPYGGNVTNGALKIEVISPAVGDPQLMGLAIYSCGNSNPPVSVTITPTNPNLCPGSSVTLGSTVSGTGPFGYEWSQNGSVLTGQNASTLVLTNVSATNAGTYAVVVTAANNTSATDTTSLTVNSAVGATPLTSLNTLSGTTATFNTTASGTGPFGYTWYQNGAVLSGPVANNLTLNNVGPEDAGIYSVVVSGACGTPVTNSATLTVTVEGSARAPTVFIMTPSDGDSFAAPATIRLMSVAQNQEGMLTNVSYFLNTNGVLLGSSTLSPYRLSLTNLLNGNYQFVAVASNDRGLATTSAAVNIAVFPQPPAVCIVTPQPNTEFAFGEPIVIEATASDVDGMVTNVQFRAGAFGLGNDTSSPYSSIWSNAPQTALTNLFAIATDNDGLSTTSAPVPITVNSGCVNVPGVSNLVLGSGEMFGGGQLSGTVVLSNCATAGGQAVNLYSSSANVTVPVSVFVPEGQWSNSFTLNALPVSATNIVTISATYHGQPARTANLIIDSLVGGSTNAVQYCGPMDVVFVIDTTESMQWELESIKSAMTNMLNDIIIASGGDYRLGLVTFDGFTPGDDSEPNCDCTDNGSLSGDFVCVRQTLSFTNRDQIADALMNLTTGDGACSAECSDEALNTVINALPARNRNQCGDFNTRFRPEARKMVILVTDAPPGGFDDPSSETYPSLVQKYMLAAHTRALQAATNGIQISAIYTGGQRDWSDVYPVPDIYYANIMGVSVRSIMQDYADTTGGVYVEDPYGTNTGFVINGILAECGNSEGWAVYVRDDQNRLYSSFAAAGSQPGAAAAVPAMFDTQGVWGKVVGARVQRAGTLQSSPGSRFDVEIGVGSLAADSSSFGLLFTNAHKLVGANHYSAEWELPANFYPDAEAHLDGTCSFLLFNRMSSLCGRDGSVTDNPQAAWPWDKNTLTLAMVMDLQIPQGHCRDFILPSGDSPLNGTWDIVFRNKIIASSGNPNGWDVEDDYTAFGGFIITAPVNAVADKAYDIRTRQAGWDAGRSARFDVLPADAIQTAPILLPLALSTNLITLPATVTLMVSLDSPAPFGGAYVPLYTNGTACMVAVVPAGETSTIATIQAAGAEGSTFEILASYNGCRKAKVRIDNGCVVPGRPLNLVAQNDPTFGAVVLTWTTVTNATSYTVSRGPSITSSLTLIFSGLDTNRFIDSDVTSGSNYVYMVRAFNHWCFNTSELATEVAYYNGTAPAPWIIPFGGIFNDRVDVLITNLISNSLIYYVTNSPILSDLHYDGSFTNGGIIHLTSSATIQAFTHYYYYSQDSRIVSADLTIIRPSPISCGDGVLGALTRTNSWSTVFGAGRYCSRYAFTADTNDIGKLLTITAASTSFDTFLLLKDASTNVLSWNDDSAADTTDSQIIFRVPSAGVYVIELTSYQPQSVGDFMLTLDCADTATLNVFTNAYPAFTTRSAPLPVDGLIDFGTINVRTRVTNYITLTNNGNEPLVISNIAVYPAASTNSGNGFSISPANDITLPHNAITNIGITLFSTQLADFNGYLSFDSNDGNQQQNPFWARVVGSARAASGPPQVSIYYPTNGTTVPVTNNVITNVALEIDALARDEDGIQKVDFLTNGFLFRTISNAPYSVVWTNPPAGQHVLVARACDNASNLSVSTGVVITVGSPVLTLSPAHPCVGISNTSFSMTATLQNAGGSPVSNTSVSFNVIGAHGMTNIVRLTDASGQATLTYTGTNFGADWIFASASVSNVPVQAGPMNKKWARNITCGNTCSDRLAPTDGFAIGNTIGVPSHYSDLYRLTGSAGDIVTFTMKSTNFSCFMFLMDTNGAVLTATNEVLNLTDARLRYILPTSNAYLLEASSADIFQTGDYTLQFSCGATPTPDIAALVSGTNLPSFGTLDFGATTNNAPVTRVLTITNKGGALLTISGYSITMPDVFSITPSPVTNLAAGGSADFTMQFLSTNSAKCEAGLILTNNDPDDNPFAVNLSAISNPDGAPPTLWIAAPSNGMTFVAPARITITAMAQPSGGGVIITNVAFGYENSFGSWLIGTATTAPYAVDWNITEPGDYTLMAAAWDSNGRVGVATNINVTVNASSQNRSPVANDDHPVVLVNSANNTLDVLANDTDPDGDPLTIVSLTPPANGTAVIIDNGKSIRYTPPHGVQGYPADGFHYQISDGKGGTAWGNILVDVYASALPAVSLAATAYTTNAGTIDPLMATVSPSQYITKVEFYLGQTLIGTVTNGVDGVYTLNWKALTDNCDCAFTATAYDRFGQMNTSPGIQINVKAPTGIDPVAQIDNLADAVSQVGDQIYTSPATIGDGLFNLIGRAYDVDSPDIAWQLQLYTTTGVLLRDFTPGPVDGSGFHPGSVGSATASGLLATCDFTTIQNGVYDLVLRAKGGYVVTEKSVRILLNTQLKVGQFGFSEQDLAIPAGGLSLAVIRTYNSLNPDQGDFGYSWTYALNDLDVALDETRQGTSDLDGKSFSLRTGGGRDVTLTLPDGRRVTFAFTLAVGGSGYTAVWKAPAGVHATLTPTVNNQLTVLPCLFQPCFPPYWEAAGPMTSWENYDFPGFILTTQDGTQYVINRENLGRHFFDSGYDNHFSVDAWGKPVLSKIILPSGDTVEISSDTLDATGHRSFSIQHKDPQGDVTRSIICQRDDQGRIISISDPISQQSTINSQPAVRYEYDSADNLSKVLKLVDRSTGACVTNQYFYENSAFPHYLTRILDARGVSIARQLYDENGKLIGIIDANGHTNRFVHDLANHTETVFDRLGNPTTYGFDTRGNVTLTVDALGHQTARTFDDDNNVTSVTDPLGDITEYGYDANGYQNAITNALGEVTRSGLDNAHRLLSKTDAAGNTTSFDYDSAGHRTKVTDPLGHSTTFGHDVYGHPTAATNALNQLRATAGSDSSGNLQFVAQAGGLRMDFGHDANGNTTNTSFNWVNPNDTNQTQTLATITELDAANRVTRVTDPDGRSRMTLYDSDGQVTQSIDRMGNTNSYIYDALGNVIQTTYADGSITRSVYDDDSKVIYADDRHLPGSAVNGTHTVYDPLGRVIRTEHLANVQIDIMQNAGVPQSILTSAGAVLAVSSTAYDAASRVLVVTNALGYVTSYEYDAAGRQTAVIDALGNRTDSVYDDGGRLIASANALLQITRYQYDAKGRRIKTIFPDSSYTTNSYNEIGQLMFVTDQAGLETDYQYDNLGRVTAVIKPQVFNPEGGTNANPRYEYDHDLYGNIVAIRDPKGHQTKFTYDALGEPISRTLPLLQTNWQSYNAFGQLDTSVDFKGQSNRFVYDSFGRVATNLLYAAGSSVPGQTNVFIYDANGRLYQTLRPEGVSTFQYNLDGAVTNITSPEGRISYEYDPAMGWLTRVNTINSDIRYGYDELGRLKTVTVMMRDRVTLTPPEVTMNTYTRLGSLENVFFPNGTRTVYQYDVMNHLTNEVNYNGASQLLAQYQYTAASDGTRLASTETRRESDGTYSTTAITWSNDALHRLVREASSSTLPALNFTNCYVYDLAGNRLWKTNSSGAGTQVTAYTYNANDQLLIESTSSVSFTNSYDANGSVTNRSSASEQNIYSYNLEGRLAGALVKRTESGQAIQQTNRYYYNQSGIRVRAEMTGSVNATNLFLNDPQNLSGFSQALEELPAMGAIPTTTYTIGNQVMAQEKSGTVSFLMPDGHGSTRLLTDASGTISDRYSYDAYGNGLDFTATTLNPPTTRLLYSGEQFDPDLQQYYLRARYYNPTAGRFGTQDQMNGTPEDPLSLHKYAYCQNNPVNGRDPSGNDDLESLSFTMSIGASLENEYYRALAKEGYIAATKVNEIGQSYNSTVDAASRDASPGVDTATIIVHGVEGVDTHGGHSSGWSKNFQQNLGPQPILNVGGKPLNHDFDEFDWGGFGILPGYGFYPIKERA